LCIVEENSQSLILKILKEIFLNLTNEATDRELIESIGNLKMSLASLDNQYADDRQNDAFELLGLLINQIDADIGGTFLEEFENEYMPIVGSPTEMVISTFLFNC